MCFSGGAPASPAPTPTAVAPDPSVVAALDADRKRRLAKGLSSTILTGGSGVTTDTRPKTLLGE